MLLVMGVLLFAWFRHPLDGGVGPRGLAFRFPFVGRLRTLAAKASFASTMAMLIRRELPLPQSLRLAAAATAEREVAERIDAMRVRAEAGSSLADSIGEGDLVSPAMMWFLEAGEASGTVATSLGDVAQVYQQRLDRSVERMCFLATPLALLSVGLVVLGFAVAYLVPIFVTYRRLFWW